MASKNATIKDIAKSANLHHTTVSRALRDDPRVKPETRRVVQDIAKRLNYSPNSFAINLRSKSSNVIGVIVPELYHDFFSNVVAEITNVASLKGHPVLICQSNEDYCQEVKNVEMMIKNRVAGVIAATSLNTVNSDHFSNLEKAGIPLVFFDRFCEDINAIRIIPDFYDGAYKVVEHMIESGCRRIAFIAGQLDVHGVKRRYAGYKKALADYKISYRPEFVINSGFTPEAGVKATSALLNTRHKPDAIFAINDEVAIGAMTCIKRAGLSIPDDIAVAGFDNDRISEFTNPALTTVDILPRDVSKKAIAGLMNRVQDKATAARPVTQYIPTRLIIRESTVRNQTR